MIAIRYKHTLTAFFGVLCAAGLLVLFSAPAQAAGPLSSLTHIQQGIDECDSDKVNQAIDVATVTDKASSALIAAMNAMVEEGRLSGNIGMALSLAAAAQDAGQGGFIKGLLVSEVKGFVNMGVNGGYFAGQPNGRVTPPKGSLASALPKMPQGRRQLLPGNVLSENDGVAQISATFVDPKAGRFALVLDVEKRGSRWVVIEIVNAKKLFEEAASREL